MTWATGSAGWTASDTITTRDKILKSTGVDGKANMVFRAMSSAEAGNPYASLVANPHKVFPHLLIQGYNSWDDVGHSGAKAYGQVGPWMMGNTSVASLFIADTAHIHRFNGTLPLASAPDSSYLGRTRRVKTADSFENGFLAFDGRRRIYGGNIVTSTQVGWSDIAHGEANFGGGGLPPQSFAENGNLTVLVHDAATDKDFIYLLNPTATLASQWLKYDVEANTWSTLAQPLWSAASPTQAACVWDGGDKIYCIRGASTTDFAVYSISGNTWTTKTATPQIRTTSFSAGAGGCATNIVYAPNSITGIGQDVIYVALLGSGTVIYRYRVTDNAWDSTSGTGALTAQQTIGGSFFLVAIGKFLYHGNPNGAPTTWYRSDMSVAPNTWTSMGTVQSAARVYGGMVGVNHIPCKVRSHATYTTNYWFLGDLDSITVVVKIGSPTPHYYWLHFGKFNGSNRVDIMTTTAGVTPGGRVTVAVDDTSKFAAGDPVLIWDPANGNVERMLIFAITDATHFTANIAGTYGTGARVGIDPTQWVAVGDGFGLCPTDPQGNGSDNEPAQYVAEPLVPPALSQLASPGASGLYQPVPISLFNADTTTVKAQVRGFLKNVGMLNSGAFPAVQSEEMIKIGGKTYVFFIDTETQRYTVDTRGLVIGPID